MKCPGDTSSARGFCAEKQAQQGGTAMSSTTERAKSVVSERKRQRRFLEACHPERKRATRSVSTRGRRPVRGKEA